MPAEPRRILLLAGTAEARLIASRLADNPGLAITASFAGATSQPADAGVPVRSGGFGGPDGLARYLVESGTDLLVDATHPFAAAMKASSAEAARACGIPCLHVIRPAWIVRPGWQVVADLQAAAATVPGDAVAFLALGRRHLDAFAGLRARYIVRSLEAPPPGWRPSDWIEASPGATIEAEAALLSGLGVTHLVARNSGGTAGAAKLEAADRLGVRVILVDRPSPPAGQVVETAAAAIDWILRRSG